MTELYIVSGFLGAGKTTLIRRMLNEVFEKKQIVLVENDFGEISVDAALLKDQNIMIKEMNAGCICCSLSGDFVKALYKVVVSYRPDAVIIEPSGVGKLSDILKVINNQRIRGLIAKKRAITVVDVSKFQKYMANYPEFFEDQIIYADTVLCSHMDREPLKLEGIAAQIRQRNKGATLLLEDIRNVEMSKVLFNKEQKTALIPAKKGRSCLHGHCNCHKAEEIFDTVTIRTKDKYENDELEKRLKKLLEQTCGEVLRAKGIVKGEEGFLNFQYIPGEMKITQCDKSGDMICVIGRNLNPKELRSLFFEG